MMNISHLRLICLQLINAFLCIYFSEAMASSGKTDKSPHDQEIKFFAKVVFRQILSYYTQKGLKACFLEVFFVKESFFFFFTNRFCCHS